MIASAMELPTTLGGWVGVAVGLITVASFIGGTVIALLKLYVDPKVESRVQEEVTSVVDVAMKVVNAKLDGIRLNQANLSEELSVVRRLEVKIENGLSTRVENIETRQDVLISEISSVHATLRAQYQWDGEERRDR